MAQNTSLFEQGKEQYRAENYQEALSNWMRILDNGAHSANLYYNIGNAHYQLHHIGPSIYYYEKAKLLAPNDADIENNLAFAKNATVDVIEPLPQTFFVKIDQSISTLLSFDNWAWLAVICLLLFTYLFLKYFFSNQSKPKRLYFASSSLFFIVGLIALSMAFKTFHQSKNKREAIIFSEAVDVKSGPRMSDQTIFQLHEGTKVKVIGQEDNWGRILLANGKDGWIPFEDIKEL